MRILCLHGQGSSAVIFESQLSRLIAALPSHYSFDFVDAPLSCGPGLDIGGVYPGPYYCFFDSYTPERMVDAIDYVREVIDEDGPYEAIIAFSQGASVAAAYISACQTDPQHPMTCAFAVFLCTALIPPSAAADTTKLEETIGLLIPHGPLSLPTVHVLGSEDLCLPQSLKMADSASTPGLGQALHFPGGHEIPKDPVTIDKLQNAIEKAARLAFRG